MKGRGPFQLWHMPILAYVFPLLVGIIFIAVNLQTQPTDQSIPVRLSFIIPEIIIWTVASVCAFRFKRYAESIKTHNDGKALNKIANALLLLVLYIILLTTGSTIVSLFARSPYLLPAIALRNHLPIAVAIASAVSLLRGSKELNSLTGTNFWTRRRRSLLLVSTYLFLVVFGWVFIRSQPDKLFVNGIPRFALPVEALLFTYVIPHVTLWFIGFNACMNIANFANKTSGIIYKALFSDFYRGLTLTYICVFVAQFLIITSLTISRPGLASIIIYGILLFSLVGFLLILRGAKKLNAAESVTVAKEEG